MSLDVEDRLGRTVSEMNCSDSPKEGIGIISRYTVNELSAERAECNYLHVVPSNFDPACPQSIS